MPRKEKLKNTEIVTEEVKEIIKTEDGQATTQNSAINVLHNRAT